jgi:hypothetical protein
VTRVRRALLILLILGAGLGLVTGAALAKAPTAGQIRAAVQRAERSRDLWATVNICSSRRFPKTLGIRGQMPSLGFAADLSMDITARYYSKARRRFIRVSGRDSSQLVSLGRSSRGLQQGGAEFTFLQKRFYYFDASVRFVWRRSGRLIGARTLITTGGHPGADFGSPPHRSTRQCHMR